MEYVYWLPLLRMIGIADKSYTTEHPRVAYIHRISYTSTEMDEDDLTIYDYA